MESAITKTPNRGYHLVRIAVAVLLLTASALKCWQLATEPILGTSLLDSRWLLMATVEFELLFGFWLLANNWAKPTWAAALACFGLFACVSVCKAISGHATCGCFGRVPVNPWYTGTLDLAVVLSLLRWRPRESCLAVHRAVTVVLLWLAVGIPAAYAMGVYADTTLSASGEILGSGDTIVLEPEAWIGNRLPLLPFVDDIPADVVIDRHTLREQLSHGKWQILLYRHDCSKCQEAIQRWRLMARAIASRSDAPRFALLELPPYDMHEHGPRASNLPLEFGRIGNGKAWFAATPLIIAIEDGRVVSRHRDRDQIGELAPSESSDDETLQ
jgi:hypothetical protein